MNKKELDMLEKVFAEEVNSAFSQHGIHLLQTKSQVAKKLTEEGYLHFTHVNLGGGVRVYGYELTELGRITYCTSQ